MKRYLGVAGITGLLLALGISGFKLFNTPTVTDLGGGSEPVKLFQDTSLVYPSPAIAFDATTISNQAGCDPCTWSHTVTTGGSNRIVVVAVTHEPKSGNTVLGVSYAGAGMTNVRTDTNGTAAETSIWYKTGPATGPNTVSVDFSATASRSMFISYSFTNVEQASPIDAHNGAIATSGTSTVDVTTVDTDAWIIDASIAKAAHTMVARTGRTERMNESTGPFGAGSSTMEATSAGAYTMDWTLGSSKAWAISAASLDPG